MSRRDVNLVIKARDEAASVLTSITKALDEFVVSQRDLDKQADSSRSSLGELGAAFARLKQQTGDLDFGRTMQREVQTAQQSVDRLENSLANTQTELASYEKRAAQAAVETQNFSRKLAGAEAAQARYKQSVAELAGQQKRLTADLKEASTTQTRLQKEYDQLPGKIARTSAAYDNARERVRQFRDALIRANEPSQTLIQNYERATRAVDRNAVKLGELQARYSTVRGELTEAAASASRFEAALNRTTERLERQTQAFNKITTNVRDLRKASTEASSSQARLERNVQEASARFRQQSQNLAEAKREMAATIGTTEQLAQAQRQLAGQARGEIVKDLGRQRQQLAETRDEWKRLEAAIASQRQEIRQAGVQTREQAENLQFLEVAAREAKTNTELLDRALREQLSILRQSKNETLDMATAQERLAGVQARLAQALRQAAQSTQQQRNALNSANAEYSRARERADRLAVAAERSANANRRNARETRGLAAAWREFYGGTRQSLSLLQRIRGEVLSLAAAYGGLFGAINTGAQSLAAIQTIEAATARLTVATGSAEAAERELDFLRRTADRLGIQFGQLSNEYSKFAVATQSSNISAQETREIFVGIAEAARVNRSSTAQLSGVFTALTQIVSKGAVQQEELRQQLGDRLPGALQIMADALGITTAELVKMTEQGQLTERALIPFAEELRNRFGGGLDEALNGITTSLGRLQNAAFQALASFAEAGFADAIQDIADAITELLSSADFQAFIESASSAVSGLIGVLQFAVENFQLFAAAIAAFAGFKLTGLIGGIAISLLEVATGARDAERGLRQARVQAVATTGAFGRLGVAARGLSASLAFLLSSGAGIAVAAVAAGLALWATEADGATEALVRHREQLDEIKNAYEEANGDVTAFRENVEGITISELDTTRSNLLDAREAQLRQLENAIRQEGAGLLNTFFGRNIINFLPREAIRQLEDLADALREGRISAEEAVASADELFQTYDDGSAAFNRLREGVFDAIREVEDLDGAVEETDQAIVGLTGTAEDAKTAMDDLTGAAVQAANAYDVDKAEAFNAAAGELREIIDELIPKSEELEIALQIDGAFEEAISNAQTLEERLEAMVLRAEAVGAATNKFADDFLQGFSGSGDFTQITSAFLRQEEGFRETPYFDVDRLRAGFGSSTVTLANGSVRDVTEGTRVSLADANRDLERRINQEFAPRVAKQIGQEAFERLAPNQQAALTSIAYNSGSLPANIVNTIRNGGTTDQIAAAIVADINRVQNLPKLNETEKRVVSERRRKEAALFRSGALDESIIREQQRADEERARNLEREAELAQQARESIEQNISDQEFELSLQNASNVERETALALREAEREAQEAGIALTEDQRQRIIAVTAAKFADKDAQEAINETLERAQEAQQQLNLLTQQREAILKQIELAEDEGDNERLAELRDRLAEVDEKLVSARDNAIAMWKAVGGQEAATAIEQVRAGAAEAQKLSEEASKTTVQWERVSDLFANGLTNAFMSFAQAIAEGKSASEAAREAFLKFAADFLIQIAQMIIRAAIFRALSAAFGGTAFGNLIGVPTGHTGGLAGSSRIGSGNATRKVSPALFAFARRFHEGGIPGLKPGEVPAILKQNEEVLTRDDPRHMLNGGSQGGRDGGGQAPTIINAVDGSDALEQALSHTRGGEILMNYVRANRTQFRAALEE